MACDSVPQQAVFLAHLHFDGLTVDADWGQENDVDWVVRESWGASWGVRIDARLTSKGSSSRGCHTPIETDSIDPGSGLDCNFNLGSHRLRKPMLIRSISAVFAVICLVASLRAEPPQLSFQAATLGSGCQ